jgi:PAS domain S-box-containing protein
MNDRPSYEELEKRLKDLEQEYLLAKETARESEERYQAFFERSFDIIYVHDFEGRFLDLNNSALTMLGYSRDEVPNLTLRTLLTDDQIPIGLNIVKELRETGSQKGSSEYMVRRKDGGFLWLETRSSVIYRGGEPYAIQGVARDITGWKVAQEQLRNIGERYRTIFENTGNASILVGEDTTILLANSNFEKLSGYSRLEMEGKMSWTVFIADEDLEMMKRYHVQRRIDPNSAPPNSYEFRFKNRFGEMKDIFLTLAMIPGTNESVASCMDITERKRAEEAMCESEERYRSILENMEEAYYEVDLKGNFTFFNSKTLNRLGYTINELNGMNFRNYMDKENARKVFNAYHSVFLSGKPITGVDWELKDKSGRRIFVEASVSLRRDDDGDPTGFRGVVRDITERKQAEEALRQSEEKYRTILENMEEAYFETDLKGSFTFFNDSLCKVLGYSRQELMGMHYSVYSTPESAGKASQIFNEILRTGISKTMVNYEIMRKDGDKRVIEASISLMYGSSGEAAGFRGIGRDITERIQAEHAIKESERRYRLLAENLRDVIWVLDPDLHYVYVSPSVMELRGYTPEEVMKRTIDQTLTPESYQKVVDLFTQERLLEFGGQMHGKEWSKNIELEMIRKDGSTVWTEVKINILYDEAGNPTGILGITRDISERKKVEKALRESEERWQFALEGAGDGVWDFDVPGGKGYRSRRWKEMLGYAENDISDSPDEWMNLVHPDDRQQSYENLIRHLKGEMPIYTSEHRVKCKDGTYKWILERGKVIRWSEDGRPLRIIGTQTDITDRKQSEEAIKKSEERYRTIFENTATSNMIVAEDTTILLVNSNFEKLTGYSKQEVENKMSWTHFVMKEEIEMMKQYHMKRRFDPGSAPSAYEFKVRIRSGEIRNLFMSVAIIPGTRDSVASIIDMTDRKQAEESLKRSEERFRDIANLLPETVFETDENGIVTFVNQSSLKQFGFTQAEVDKGMNIMDAFALEDRDRLIMNYQRVMQGERLGLNEYTAQRKDGSTFPALVHSTVIYRNGKSAGLRGFLIDITDQKNLEQQLMRAQKMEAIGTLAGGIAHDFNNLLMGILGNVSLMLMNCDGSNPFFDRLKSVEEYVQRGSDLSKQLLGFARGGKYEVKPTHLGEFIRKSSELFGRTKKEIRIHHKVAEGLWSVEVDRGQMEQVLLNLFVNAWQAMPGGGDMYLSVENVNLDKIDVSPYDIKPGRFVKVTVTDTGIGMDDLVKSRIFEPFFTTKERGRGTGLGLASVYGIIKNHGGFIHVESEKDFGTSFMIYLSASEKYVQNELGTKDEIMKGQEAVLLIDDEEMILDVGSKMLETLGYKVMPAPGGRQGLLIYEQNMDKIDLVVLDIIMPDLGGKETFDTLLRINPAVRVLLSSGYSLDGQAKEIMQSGCKGFIQKPFSMAELSKKIREILDSDQ